MVKPAVRPPKRAFCRRSGKSRMIVAGSAIFCLVKALFQVDLRARRLRVYFAWQSASRGSGVERVSYCNGCIPGY
jgi:hypothetical protein